MFEDDGTAKVRPTDDFTASMVNAMVTANEKVVLHTLDVICAMLAYFLSKLGLDAGPEHELVGKSVL